MQGMQRVRELLGRRWSRQRQRQRLAVPKLLVLRRRRRTLKLLLLLRIELLLALQETLLQLLGPHGLQPVPPIPDRVVRPARQALRNDEPAMP